MAAGLAAMELDEANGGAGSAHMAEPLSVAAVLKTADLSGMRAAFRPAIPEERFQEAASRLIDVKALTRPGVFDGHDREWMDWRFRFEGLCSLIDIDGLMAAVQSCDVSDVEVLELEFPMRSKLLYNLLVAYCQGRALGIVRAVVRFSGLMAWRKLVSEYEPDLASRRMSMLSGILNPSFLMEKFPAQILEW